MNPIAVFRVDASVLIGTGHLMRCLTLAKALKVEKVESYFICRDLPGNLIPYLEAEGFKVYKLPYSVSDQGVQITENPYEQWLGECYQKEIEQAAEVLKSFSRIDILIIDHYAIEKKWELMARVYAKKILVIDDIANRLHDCDFLLDQNLSNPLQDRYRKLAPKNCCLLLGSQYALLRAEFLTTRLKTIKQFGELKHIFLFMGGSDLDNMTSMVLTALLELNFTGEVEVVIGSQNKAKEEIKAVCQKHSNFHFYCQVNNLAELMSQADLAICASGTTTWERCCIGLPGLVITTAENQEHIAEKLQQLGIDFYVGKSKEITINRFIKKLNFAFSNKDEVKRMSKVMMNLVDGNGAKRVIEKTLIER
ncbi:MAG: UDP-2,4-diacetamido-2,4,6-trideoxy-beta-L-altropyranose hydrolase [Gammaproteobacteria bacterium RIFCSPHIGHO2_12_FULL_35_23]|nr:MAG: UDP-2,4-diacetamido-2,4,6-trideoxy-beta-L-altropyranose hydrolase [Gammaproteobacteria bacterium RIFCSPHIGHO2_12_FULL_35_23]